MSIFNSLYKKASTLPSSYSIFVPDDSAFDILHSVELSYLNTHFAEHDREGFLLRHACHDILYTKDLRKGGKVSSLEGEKIHYEPNDTDIFIDNGNVTQPDVIARNGKSLLPLFSNPWLI